LFSLLTLHCAYFYIYRIKCSSKQVKQSCCYNACVLQAHRQLNLLFISNNCICIWYQLCDTMGWFMSKELSTFMWRLDTCVLHVVRVHLMTGHVVLTLTYFYLYIVHLITGSVVLTQTYLYLDSVHLMTWQMLTLTCFYLYIVHLMTGQVVLTLTYYYQFT